MRIHMPMNLVKAIIKGPDGCASFEDTNRFTAHTHIPFYDALVLYTSARDAGEKLLTIDDDAYQPDRHTATTPQTQKKAAHPEGQTAGVRHETTD